MHFTLLAATAVALLPILSCETSSGVRRSAALTSVPDPSCIKLALESVPAIESVNERHHHPYEDVYKWDYETSDGLYGYLVIKVTGEHITFIQPHMVVHRHIPHDELQRHRRLMVQIEGAIEARCIADLSSRIKERCTNIRCPPLNELESRQVSSTAV